MLLNEKFRAELVGSERVKNYILGGHGVVTLMSDTTGAHHTYRFEAPSNRKPNDDMMFIYTLVDGSNWTYVGMYRNGAFRLTAKSKFGVDTSIVKGIAFIFKMMLNSDFKDDRMHLLHEGICSRCGRPLTNPASIELGIGPTCYSKL